MLVKTNNRWEAVRALVNTLLKDNRFYCNNCDSDYRPWDFPCCESPQVGRHIDHIRGIVKQNKMIRETRNNKFASTQNKSMRWGISLPPRFFFDLERGFKKMYEEKLLRDNKDLHEFMREFPAFCVCEAV